LKLTVLPKTSMYTPKANPKQNHVETTQEHEKGALLLNNSPRGRTYSQWRAKGEQTLLSVTHCSPWRVDGEQTLLSVTHCSPWRAD